MYFHCIGLGCETRFTVAHRSFEFGIYFRSSGGKKIKSSNVGRVLSEIPCLRTKKKKKEKKMKFHIHSIFEMRKAFAVCTIDFYT